MKIPYSSLFVLLLSVSLFSSSTAGAQRHYRDYHHRHYYPVRAQRVVYDYRPRYVVPYRGYSYHYDEGYFYRPPGSYVQVVVPPVGIRVAILPRGYRPIYTGGQAFFYFNGTFYRRAEHEYEVVKAPIGAALPDIPDRARVVVVDDQKYYEYDGTYYKERIRSNGEIWYEVVGKNGRLQTDAPERDVRPGSMVSSLPSDCKMVIINNEKYWVSPDHVYYQEVIEHDELGYKVVGTPQ